MNGPIKANDIDVEIFASSEHNDNIEEYQLAINGWLKNQPNNVYIQDVIYRHAGRTSRGKDILSMVILSSQSKS
ncbi:hypothetical protein ACFLVJ_01805 [Chloroflexota bacterium]